MLVDVLEYKHVSSPFETKKWWPFNRKEVILEYIKGYGFIRNECPNVQRGNANGLMPIPMGFGCFCTTFLSFWTTPH